MSIFVSKETIQRLRNDIVTIIKNPLNDNGIYYKHSEDDLLKGYAMIIGQEDTPYFGGYYFFELCFPNDYPYSPPKVIFCTNGNGIRMNPNLYTCGKVCVSILNTWTGESWNSCQTVSTILLTLSTLLCNNPLLNEPGVTKSEDDVIKYNNIIEFANIDVGICDIISKKIYLPFFDIFIDIIKENFIKNIDKYINFVQNKINENKTNFKIYTRYYGLNIFIDYIKVLNKLNELKEI